MRLAEDGTVVGVFANRCEALGVQKEKSRLCCGASSLPDTCMPWPDPNPAGGKCSLSTDLTGEIFPPPPGFTGRKGLGNETGHTEGFKEKCVPLAVAKHDELVPKSLACLQSPLGISQQAGTPFSCC